MSKLLSLLLAAFLSASVLGDDAIRPDPKLTPGKVALSDEAVVCATRWGRDVRHVTLSMKKEVFAEYGVPWSRHSEFEVDHLISRELGGADDVLNLWPQPWAGQWNAHLKDRLENRLHRDVCAGALTLGQAQQGIASDWIGLYQKIFNVGNKRKVEGADCRCLLSSRGLASTAKRATSR